MVLTLLQIAAVVAVAAYLYRWVAAQKRRNAQSWKTLIGQLRLEDGMAGVSALWLDDEAPAGWRQRLRAAHELWAIFQNAGVMLTMADYAARHGANVDSEMLDSLRMDALQIRVYTVRALARCALSTARDAAAMNALRVQAAYAEMTLQVTELLEARAEEMIPSFVAAL